MKAEDKSFYFLATPSYYDIPFFQRAYVWGEENWSELLNNLTSVNQNHFLGSIILKNEVSSAGSVARYLVIDGQQRLTSLLFRMIWIKRLYLLSLIKGWMKYSNLKKTCS